MTSEPQTETIEKTWPDYRAVWRWHFYASLFCIPFVIILAISGAIYLFKEEVEAGMTGRTTIWTFGEARPPPPSKSARLLAAVPGRPRRLRIAQVRPRSCAGDRADGKARRSGCMCIPQRLQVLHTVPEDERFMGCC